MWWASGGAPGTVPPPTSQNMKCSSWNVNGLRALVKKGLAPWDVLSEFGVLCLQETKAQPGQLAAESILVSGARVVIEKVLWTDTTSPVAPPRRAP